MRLELRGGGGLEEALLGLLEVDDTPDRVEVLRIEGASRISNTSIFEILSRVHTSGFTFLY